MNPPTFNPVNSLEEALMKGATDISVRPEFYRQLLNSELYVLSPYVPDQQGWETLRAGTNITFMDFKGQSGLFTPIFSSKEMLGQAIGSQGQTYSCFGIKGKDLFPLLAQHQQPAILNPGVGYGKEFPPDEIQRIANGTFFKGEERVLKEGTRVLYGQPTVYPTALVEAFKKLFVNYPQVKAAYVAQFEDPSSGEKAHLIIGIEADGDLSQTLTDVGIITRNVLEKGEFVDIVQVTKEDRSNNSYFKTISPFYKKESKGIFSWLFK